MKQRWNELGSPGEFLAFFQDHTRGIVDDLARLRERLDRGGQTEKLEALDDAIKSSWLLYKGKHYQDVGALIENLRSDKNSDSQMTFGLEMVRQIVELNHDGSMTNDTFYKALVGKLTQLLSDALRALHGAWKGGDISSPLLQEAVTETESAIELLVQQFPQTRAIFNQTVKNRLR